MSAIDIFLAKGKRGMILEKDWLTREEKDAVRARFGPEGRAGVWFLEMEPEAEPEPELVEVTALEDEDRVFVEAGSQQHYAPEPGGEPVMSDLRALKVDRLRKLADSENVDLTGLKAKADILGRLAAHFGLDPAE